VKFVVSRLGCDRLIKKSQVVGNPCNNPKASHMYAELVNLIANETPFNDQKIKKLIIKLCEGDCANWDSFYHIFEAMGLRGLNPNSRRSIIDKFVTLFGGYLVLGAHFTINVRNEITIGWFDNIGKLHPNDLLERPDNIEWTKLMNHSKWKWYGYSSSGDQLANDKLTPAEIYNALKKRFPHNHTYKFELSDTADLQISNSQQVIMEMEMGGRRRTKRNVIPNRSKRNANANANANQIKRNRNPTKKHTKNMPIRKSTRRRR